MVTEAWRRRGTAAAAASALAVAGLGAGFLHGLPAAAWHPWLWAALMSGSALVALFALFHGYAHGAELPAAAHPFVWAAGCLLGTGALHLAGLGLGRRLSGRGAPLLRMIGAAMGLTGLWLLAGA